MSSLTVGHWSMDRGDMEQLEVVVMSGVGTDCARTWGGYALLSVSGTAHGLATGAQHAHAHSHAVVTIARTVHSTGALGGSDAAPVSPLPAPRGAQAPSRCVRVAAWASGRRRVRRRRTIDVPPPCLHSLDTAQLPSSSAVSTALTPTHSLTRSLVHLAPALSFFLPNNPDPASTPTSYNFSPPPLSREPPWTAPASPTPFSHTA